MIQKYAFTTAAMAAALEDTPISYEDLAEIEKDFDDAETEVSMYSLPLSNFLKLLRAPVCQESLSYRHLNNTISATYCHIHVFFKYSGRL